jgi:hypothetical protein
MATVGNIIQRVQSLYSKGAQSNSSRLMSRHIYDKMMSTRALLFYNKINKRQFMSKWNYDILPCVELIAVSENDCPCLPIPGCDILRTKNKLPKPMNSINGYVIDSVLSVNGQVIFNEVTYKSKIWRGSDKYTSAKPDWFIKDDYIYITTTRKLKAITVMGLFADPIAAANYPTKCGVGDEPACPIHPKEMDFPLDDEMVDALVQLTVQELSVGFAPGYEDRRNDSADHVEGSQQPQRQSQKAPQQPRRRNPNE